MDSQAEIAKYRADMLTWEGHCARLAENNRLLGIENTTLLEIIRQIDDTCVLPKLAYDRLAVVRMILSQNGLSKHAPKPTKTFDPRG